MKNKWCLTILLPLALNACASGDKLAQSRTCPQVAILRSLEKMEDHGQDMIEPSTLVGVGYMQRIEGSCHYTDEGVDVDFTLHMMAAKGPRLGGDRISFPYSISLINPSGSVIAKEMITADFLFDNPDEQTALLSESLHVFVPVGENEDASLYRVLAGFQLTEAQVEVMRKGNQIE